MKLAIAALTACLALPAVACAQNPLPPATSAPPAPYRIANASPGEIRMLITNAIKPPIEAVLPEAMKAIGKPVVIQWGSARGNLKNEALTGQPFEVAILLPDVDEELLAKGLVAPGTWELARVEIGFAIRGDAPNLDLSTPEAVKAAMLGATSVKYAPTGAALLTVRKILTTFDIADKIKDSSKRTDLAPLAPGQYEINIYPMSEIVGMKTLQNRGPVIPALQVPSIIEATIGKNANDPTAALALIKFLQGPAIDASLKSSAMIKSTASKP